MQLGEHQDKSKLPLQLRVCRTFCLMRSLNNLFRSLHSQRQDNKKMFDVLFKPKIPYSESSTVVLREAVNKLIRHQPNIPSEVEPLKSVMVLKSWYKKVCQRDSFHKLNYVIFPLCLVFGEMYDALFVLYLFLLVTETLAWTLQCVCHDINVTYFPTDERNVPHTPWQMSVVSLESCIPHKTKTDEN